LKSEAVASRIWRSATRDEIWYRNKRKEKKREET